MSSIQTRGYHSFDDAMAIVALRVRSGAADGRDARSIVDTIPPVEVIHEIAADAGSTNWQISMVDGAVAGYANVGSSWTEVDGTRVYLHDGCVDPDTRGRGLGTVGLRWAEERISQISQSAGDATQAVFGTSAGSNESSRTDLLCENGYQPAFSIVEMELVHLGNLPDVSAPDGVAVAEARPDDIRTVWELNEDVYGDRPFTQVTDGFNAQRFRAASGSDLSLWTLAWERERLVGFVISRAGATQSEITEVSVSLDCRRKGLASALLLSNLQRLHERGHEVVRLHTNGEDVSGARSLYAKLGFRHVQTFVRYRKRMAS